MSGPRLPGQGPAFKPPKRHYLDLSKRGKRLPPGTVGSGNGAYSPKAVAYRAARLAKGLTQKTSHPSSGSGPTDEILACPNPECGKTIWRGANWPGDWRQCWSGCGEWWKTPPRGEKPVREDAAGRRGERVTSRPDNHGHFLP